MRCLLFFCLPADRSKGKAWKDIWGCGQGIGAVSEVVPTATLVERLRREYRAAQQRLAETAA